VNPYPILAAGALVAGLAACSTPQAEVAYAGCRTYFPSGYVVGTRNVDCGGTDLLVDEMCVPNQFMDAELAANRAVEDDECVVYIDVRPGLPTAVWVLGPRSFVNASEGDQVVSVP
jgi:hypothetical protein